MATEKRLIDANALEFDPDENCVANGVLIWGGRTGGRTGGKTMTTVLAALKKMIDNAPTVDAVEVVHGKWHIDDYDSGDPGYYEACIEVHCSECGYELGAESGQYGWDYGDPFPLNYCPNCGARMDGGADSA